MRATQAATSATREHCGQGATCASTSTAPGPSGGPTTSITSGYEPAALQADERRAVREFIQALPVGSKPIGEPATNGAVAYSVPGLSKSVMQLALRRARSLPHVVSTQKPPLVEYRIHGGPLIEGTAEMGFADGTCPGGYQVRLDWFTQRHGVINVDASCQD